MPLVTAVDLPISQLVNLGSKSNGINRLLIFQRKARVPRTIVQYWSTSTALT